VLGSPLIRNARNAARASLFAALVVAILPPALLAQYDVVVRGGRLLDGTGNPWRRADLAISGDSIAAVGDLKGVTGLREIDATGLYVAPGFIDVHSHAGPGLATPSLSHARPLLAQGVTTVFVNPDGGGPVDLSTQRAALERDGLGVNVALLVPHGSVREEVLGMQDRAPTLRELQMMRDLVRGGMEEGAFGLSSGLYYAPGSYSTTEEVIELAKVAAEYGGAYTSHIRDEADYNIGVVAAVDEVIRIAREAGLRGVVSHIKALGPRVWGFSQAIVLRIEQARAQGIEVFADQYPYSASGTGITGALIPRWAQVGGRDSLLARLRRPNDRATVRADVIENLDRRGGAAQLQFQRYAPDPSIEGRSLQSVADERGQAPADLALQLLERGDAGLVSFNMSDADIETFMKQPWMMTCSDGGLVEMNIGVPHPRYYGSFSRKIRKYVVEDSVITLEVAIRSMTSLPASVFRVQHRGMLRVGERADVVVFDIARLRDRATYDQPHQLSEGMVHVFVNGRAAVSDGQFTGQLAGRVLTR